MITHNNIERKVIISNNTLKFEIDYSSGITIKKLINSFSDSVENKEFEAFELEMHGFRLTSKDFEVQCSILSDEAEEVVQFLAVSAKEQFKARLSFINDLKDSISLLYQFWDDYKFGAPSVVKLHMPILCDIDCGENERIYYPSMSVKAKKGTNVIIPMRESFYSSDVLLPLVFTDRNDKFGYSIEFPTESDLSDTGATQNVNKILTTIASYDGLKNHNVEINPDPSFNDCVELKFTGLKNGWPEAFDRYRDVWRARYDFAEYRRPDLQWLRDTVVNNFFFMYGEEGMNRTLQKCDVEGLVKQGKEFGGYDTVCFWNMYPRLGVDCKSEWEFYDDYPGGRKALREMVDEFHKYGVKVLLPYIPWDKHSDMNDDQMGDEFAKITYDLDGDGWQLDTCVELPETFRGKVDALRPGVVLQAQHHPGKKHPLEYLTSSWDEFWRNDPMPEVDVLRFLCPEHIAPVLGRWLRLEDKWKFIKRCEFGGASIVIWQDIFGRWMPFIPEQKERIKNWKKVYLAHKDVYLGSKPIPLYPTFHDDLYCNIFCDDEGRNEIYSFYNDGDHDVTVTSLPARRNVQSAEVILGDSRVEFSGEALKNFTVGSHETLQILVK